MPNNIFNYVKVSQNVSRSKYDLSYENIFDCEFGKGIPCMARFCLPGDIWKITNIGFFRTLPLFAPIFTGIKVTFRNFFVPLRLIEENAEDIITGGEDGNNTDSFEPYKGKVEKYGFHDYLGVGLNHRLIVDSSVACRNYWYNAYRLIYNEWYRDQLLQDELELKSYTSSDSDDLWNVNYQRDYFTSALLSQQLGTAPAIPLTGVLPISYNSENGIIGNVVPSGNDVGNKVGVLGQSVFTQGVSNGNEQNPMFVPPFTSPILEGTSSGPNIDIYQENGADSYGNGYNYLTSTMILDENNNSPVLFANLANAGGQFGIQDIRRGFALESILELNNRAGSKYNEFLRANFGISPTDETLQRPVYLGGSRSYINVSEVLQNSETTATSPLGTQAGKGIGLTSSPVRPYLCKEFGIMMTIMSITPDTQYISQGVNRQYSYASRWDFFNPLLQNLGEQGIKNGELYIPSSSESIDDRVEQTEQIFGYQPMYQELRFNDNIICGGFRDTLDYWHLGRKFGEQPNLDSDFITVDNNRDNLSRIFNATDSATYKPFYCHVYNKLSVLRPLVKYPIPATL